MTPVQLAGYFHLARQRRKIEQAELLGHIRVAFHAKPADASRWVDDLLDEDRI